MEIKSNINSLYSVNSTKQSDALFQIKNKAITTIDKVDKTTQSFQQITSKYDVMNISPNEIDQLGAELREYELADVRDILMMETHGANFLSHLPGQYYGEEKLNQRENLLQIEQDQLDMARKSGLPTASLERSIAFLKEIQSQGKKTSNQISVFV